MTETTTSQTNKYSLPSETPCHRQNLDNGISENNL